MRGPCLAGFGSEDDSGKPSLWYERPMEPWQPPSLLAQIKKLICVYEFQIPRADECLPLPWQRVWRREAWQGILTPSCQVPVPRLAVR